MLFLPYSTDAPVYHYPIATGGIIAANTTIFLATTFQASLGHFEYDQLNWLILMFDQINPFQWITNNFMHAGFMHLISNMFFLWAFGLVVEGKIGSLKFLTIYMLMGAAYGALVQIPMFFISGEGGALGASGVIFSVIMIALLWAPENEIECFYWVIATFGMVEIRIVKLAGTFLIVQILFLWLGGFSMSSEMLHLAGAVIGVPVGLWMLRSDLVDCEDWDLISRNEWLQGYDLLFTDKQRQRLKDKKATIDDPVAAALRTSSAVSVSSSARLAARAGTMATNTKQPREASSGKQSSKFRRKQGSQAQQKTPPRTNASVHPEFNRLSMLFRQALKSGSALIAQQHFAKLDQLGIASGLSDKMLFAYVKLLASADQMKAAMRPLRVMVDRGGPAVGDAQLRIAHIELNVLKKPDRAAKTLRQIRFDDETITDAQRKVLHLRDGLLAKCSDTDASHKT